MDPVSIVIACPRAASYALALQSVASGHAQTTGVELIFVHDEPLDVHADSLGSNCRVIRNSAGLAAARNDGFEAAAGKWIVSLHPGDILFPEYVWALLNEAEGDHRHAFFYTDSDEPAAEYNADDLLETPSIPATAFIRKQCWQDAGGFDERLKSGYEDWEFWIRLAGLGLYGRRISRKLYIKTAGVSGRLDEEVRSYIRSKHAGLYTPEARGRFKARWAPVVRVVGAPPATPQTIYDWDFTTAVDLKRVLETRAQAFLIPNGLPPGSHSIESAALGIWSGKDSILFSDGALAVSRRSLANCESTEELRQQEKRDGAKQGSHTVRKWPAFLMKAHDQMAEAELFSRESWKNHPFQTLLRLIPLRAKEAVNHLARRPVFDLSFYLQFQPGSLDYIGAKVERLQYSPKLGARRRIAFITPHLGPGGAESVMLDMARSIDREHNELFLIATHSRDDRWARMWRDQVDHVYDLAGLAEPESIPSVLYSLIVNWDMDTVLLQNTLFAYAILPQCKQALPELKIVDLLHAVGSDWDIASATTAVAPHIDIRIVISESARRHVLQLGAPADTIRLIQNGVDLDRFRPAPAPDKPLFRILFAARLDPVKRPLLLVRIARELTRMRPQSDFQFVVAGDGPEMDRLRARIAATGLEHLFELQGYIDDLAPALAGSDVLLVTSRHEGVPLTILEAFAAGRPVVASRVGAIPEILDENTGILIDRKGNEAKAFASALLHLMENPDRRQRMGRAGRCRAEQHYDCRRSFELYRDTLTPCR